MAIAELFGELERAIELLAQKESNPNLTPPIADANLGEETFHYNKSL
jgi:hypothetical protein